MNNPDGYEYGELAGELNEANALLERVKPLIELADSAPNLRLAVVDVGLQPVLYRQERGVEGLLHYIEELDAYRVVKME